MATHGKKINAKSKPATEAMIKALPKSRKHGMSSKAGNGYMQFKAKK